MRRPLPIIRDRVLINVSSMYVSVTYILRNAHKLGVLSRWMWFLAYRGYPYPSELHPLITRFVGAAWGPSGADRTQVGPMLWAPCWPHEPGYLGHFLPKTRHNNTLCIFHGFIVCIVLRYDTSGLNRRPKQQNFIYSLGVHPSVIISLSGWFITSVIILQYWKNQHIFKKNWSCNLENQHIFQ